MMRTMLQAVFFIGTGMLVLQDCTDLGAPLPMPTQQPSPGGAVSFQSGVYPLFTQYGCNNCHSSGLHAWYGTSSATYANLVNRPATAGCTNLPLVYPDSSAGSALYLRLSGFTCGDRMPKGGNAISSTDLQTVRDWIDQGASNN